MKKYYRSSASCRRGMMEMYTGALILWMLSVAFMPFAYDKKGEVTVLTYLCGAGFWIGLIATVLMAIKINLSRKKSPVFASISDTQRRFGLVHFFSNKEAVIIDILLFVTVVGCVLARYVISGNTATFIFVGLFIFSFGMHCMLNGINYRYIKYKVRRDTES